MDAGPVEDGEEVMSIRISQESSYKGNDRWNWSVWLEGPADELDRIESVDYMLHPTFRDPLRHITDRQSKFRLNSAGWGEFMIYLNIKHTDGRVAKRKHWLQLEYPARSSKGGHVLGSEPKPGSGHLSKPESGKPEPQFVYLSSGVADTRFARVLERALKTQGIEILRFEDDIAPGLPWDVSLNSALDRAKSAIFVISDRPNAWMTREIEAVQMRNIPITSVIVGSNVEIPPLLSHRQSIHLKSGEEIEGAAPSIAERLRKV
jgi:hypothetical protein